MVTLCNRYVLDWSYPINVTTIYNKSYTVYRLTIFKITDNFNVFPGHSDQHISFFPQTLFLPI